MEQCLKLERELSKTRQEVQIAQNEVNDLEKKLILTQMISQGKVTVNKLARFEKGKILTLLLCWG